MATIKYEVGDKVHYDPVYGDKENGIIKRINDSETHAWVVYKCADDWANYMDYTGQATNIEDLKPGWDNSGSKNRTKERTL